MTPSYRGASFAYLFHDKPHPAFDRHIRFSGGTISVSDPMGVMQAERDGRALCVLGLCVDSRAQLADDQICEYLLTSGDIASLAMAASRLAGRYLILYDDGTMLHVLPDALCHVQAYHAGGWFSSHEKLLADALGLRPSREGMAAKRAASPDIAMPGDMTMHSEICALLPNHHLSGGVAVRFYPSGMRQKRRTPDEAAEALMPLLLNNARAYAARYEFELPLTAGRDSRLNLAILRKVVPDVGCYTFQRSFFNEDHADCYLPPQFCEKFGIGHRPVENPPAPSEYADAIRQLCGDWTANGVVGQAYTFQKNLAGKAVLGGAVMDQIGRATISMSVPELFSGPRFFFGRLGNPSPEAYAEAVKWVKDARQRPGASVHDLFAWESFCGRWAGTNLSVTALSGLVSLNLYNCQDMLGIILSVPRHQRAKVRLHQALYERFAPEFLAVPFNPPWRLSRWLKNNSLYTLLSAYIGQWLRVMRYRKKA